jgi:hypothetical protein
MTKKVDRQILMSCLQLPCPWQAEGTVSECPYLQRPTGEEQEFPKSICRLYSTPGPHAESAIAAALGVSVSLIRREQARAMLKMGRELAGDLTFSHDEGYVTLMEQHFGS